MDPKLLDVCGCIYLSDTHSSWYIVFYILSFSMNAVGEMYRKSTKQLELEKRRNKLAELISNENVALEVCLSFYQLLYQL